MKAKSFVLTKEGNFPKWFKDEAAKGRVKVVRDNKTKEVKSVMIYAATKEYIALPGNVIVGGRNGMVVERVKNVVKKEEQKDG